MYGGNRQYGSQKKEEPIQDSSKPTFLCAKCKILKYLEDGYADLTLMDKGNVKVLGRICSTCAILLETWIKG